ncbi:MAG TPA: hypothetical protein VJV79_25500 [Polyangiaceae bacterium]|nr:hypothetical protein [Polyangiaceae bacterium]
MATTIEMMLVTTPAPPIPLNLITFTITTPSAPLFLGTLHINALPPAAGGVIGRVNPGGANATAPATHALRMGAKFQEIRQFLMSNQGPLAIQLTYDTISFLATDLNPIAMLKVANG